MKLLSQTLLIPALIAVVLSGCSGKNGSERDIQADAAQKSQIQQKYTADEVPAASQKNTVSLWAGSMEAGFLDGDNAAASFLKPYGLCAAPDGGILIVDSYANLLRVSQEGQVFSLAGSTEVLNESGLPIGGYLDGKSDESLLNHPRFAVTSAEGAVIFSDTENHCIRILKHGVIRLIAGDRTPGFKNGSYDSAQFNTPSGVAIGKNGVIYVADTLNHCIRAISADGQVSTLAGIPGQAGYQDGSLERALFCEPNDIQLGADGALYIVDKGNQRIRKLMNGEVTTVAGSGENTDPATGYIIGGYQNGSSDQAQFLYPTGLCIAQDNTIYVADTGNHCIRAIFPDGTVTTIAGTRMSGNENGISSAAKFNQPLDVYYDEGNLYISDSYNHVVRLITLQEKKGNDAP